jgi:2-dehydro-3-deoxygalactonokinase
VSGEAAYADWIAVDWGTSHLRAWAMAGDGVVRAEAVSDDGMGGLTAGFEPALLRLIDPWLGAGRAEVVACGMVGSRQGWVEAPYATTPCRPLPEALIVAPVTDPRIDVRVVPGVRQLDPPDVMRGEETQIAGYLASAPGFDGIVCLPGTHTKWVHLSAGEIVSFRSFMTGEMFELLSRLFTIRAEGLLAGLDPAHARARLSGLLIGAELAAAKPYWLGQRVALIGAPEVMGAYSAALAGLSVPVTTHDATDMTLAGLSAARAHLPEGQRPCVN